MFNRLKPPLITMLGVATVLFIVTTIKYAHHVEASHHKAIVEQSTCPFLHGYALTAYRNGLDGKPPAEPDLPDHFTPEQQASAMHDMDDIRVDAAEQITVRAIHRDAKAKALADAYYADCISQLK